MFEEIRKHKELQKANILRGFGVNSESDESTLFNKGEIEYDEFQKAVYADTAENRKLGRVGQEYHRGKGKQQQPAATKKQNSSKETENKDKKSTTNNIKEKINKIANLLEKNMAKFVDYKYSEDAEEAGITPEVAEAFDCLIYDSEDIDVEQNTFDWKDEDEVEEYKTKLENKGYKVLNLDLGDDSYYIVGLKPKKNKKK